MKMEILLTKEERKRKKMKKQTENDLKLTKEPVRISVMELLDERRIGLVVRAFNIALKEAGCGWLKARISHPTKEYLSFDIWKVDKSKEHLV